jgi:DNA-binding NarL/FixJ family response regulator
MCYLSSFSFSMSTLPTVIRLMVVDPDPVFRAGLVSGLSQFSDVRVVAEASNFTIAWRALMDRAQVDVMLVGLSLEGCQQLKTQHSQVPMLLLDRLPEAELLSAFQLGIEGYCPKGSEIAQFVTAIRALAAGQRYWSPEDLERVSIAATPADQPHLFSILRQHWKSLSVRQIDAALNDIHAQLQYPDLSALDKAFLAGRRRELKAARWFVQRLFADSQQKISQPRTSQGRSISKSSPLATQFPSAAALNSLPSVELEPVDLERTEPSKPAPSLQAIVFDRIAMKLQSNLENLTDTPLEIDILKPEKKRELLFIILRQLELILDELRFSQVQPHQLHEKQPAILHDLWQTVVMTFFGRYYTLHVKNQDIEIVPAILQDAEVVQTEILNPIPLVNDVLSHLLFQIPLTIEQTAYLERTPEAINRSIDVLENLTIQVANAVIQPLLNRFANSEAIKRGFYDRRLLSTREIERFRNDLSWRYRVERYVVEPKAIFESRYRLWVFSDYGIDRIAIYSPRSEELDQLSGLQLAVTLALETRDAIAPRLRSAIAFLGSGIVYVLTEVIGRGIGLIGRGILKGIGKSVRG